MWPGCGHIRCPSVLRINEECNGKPYGRQQYDNFNQWRSTTPQKTHFRRRYGWRETWRADLLNRWSRFSNTIQYWQIRIFCFVRCDTQTQLFCLLDDDDDDDDVPIHCDVISITNTCIREQPPEDATAYDFVRNDYTHQFQFTISLLHTQ